MRALWAFLALTALTATALAQTTLYQTSFENPPFTAGQPAPPKRRLGKRLWNWRQPCRHR
jgi:hypothetical protein